MVRFVGRARELKLLEAQTAKNSASLVTLKGRRRIGKSRLVEEFAKDKNFLVFAGAPLNKSTSAQIQRDVFAKQLGHQIGLLTVSSSDWSDLFTLLARHISEKSTVVLFDEISWMGSKDPTFLGKLKNAWDLEFQKFPNLIFIICGSVSTWIEENIIKSTAFFGRISLYLTLEELPLPDCNKLLEEQGFRGSPHEKFKLLSITGGIPWYLQQVKKGDHAEEFLKNLCFRREGLLFNEFNRIFYDLFERRSEIYKQIIETLVDGAHEYGDISKKLGYAKGGGLSTYLDDLIQSGFVSRDYTWSLKDKKPGRLSHFRLSDNYVRFYLKFIRPHAAKINLGHLHDFAIERLPGWRSILGLQFENLVLNNRQRIWDSLKIKPSDIVIDNPFFQRKTSTAEGCQVDYLIQTRFNTLFACEVKFAQNPLSMSIVSEMRDKMKRLSLPLHYSAWPVLIHVSGVEPTVEDSGYFAEIIDFREFLKDTP